LDVEGDVALGKSDGSDGVYLRGMLDFRSLVALTQPTNGIAQSATNTITIRTKDITDTISEDRLVIRDSSNIDAKQNLRVLVRFLNSSGVGIPRGTVVTLDATSSLQISSASNVANCEGTVGVVFEDIPGGVYGFIQVSGIAYVLATTSLVAGGEVSLSPTVAGYAQPTPAMATGQADFVLGAAVNADHVLLRPQLRGAIGNIYEEPVNVVSGAPADDNEITGPVSIGTLVTLPLDSRNSNQAKVYPVGSGLLEVYLNGQILDREEDYLEDGPGPTSNKIEMLIPLVVDDELTFRIELTAPAFFATSGGGGGTGDITNGQNLGIITDGAAVFASKSGTFLQFRRIKAGTGCTVTESTNSVTIDVTGGGGGATNLDGLTDVIISTPLSNQFLRYNGTNWVNQTVSLVTNLDSLSDVIISGASSGQVLSFNGTNWVNAAPSGGGATTLNDLTDVTISGPANNQVVKFNGSQWVNAALQLSTLPDVSLSAPSTGQVLTYNGSQWVNATPVGGGSNLDGLSDVVISGAATNQFLRYNGTNWVNQTVAIVTNLDSLSDVVISGATTGQVLTFNGTNWVNQTGGGGGGATTLDGLTDVTIGTPLDGHGFYYETSSSQWKNFEVEKLHRRTFDSGRVTLYAFGRITDVNNITAVKSGNNLTIASVSGTAKLVSLFCVFTNTDVGANTFVTVTFPDMNGTSDVATSHMPSTIRMAGNSNPPSQFTQQSSATSMYTNSVGAITMQYSGVTANLYTAVKMVW
jgi:hypothetical protein